ncbi:MAG: hypothetical protein IJ744_09950 [Lachnospiraceae bacterium]|nr:hypothetical protein [Lachnospiraceae bacterium]
MKRKKFYGVVALLLVLMLLLTACGAKQEEQKTEPEQTETVVTASTKEEVKKMADAFFEKLYQADPVRMTTLTDGEKSSVYTKDGTSICEEDLTSNVTYYLFEQDGVHYAIYDGETAYEDSFMYELYANWIGSYFPMFLTGYFEIEDAEDPFTYEATKTEKTENGVTTSELAYSISGEVEGNAATVRVDGKADADGNITSIAYAVESSEQNVNYVWTFDYDVTVELPAYTIESNDSETRIEWSYETVPSPYETVGDAYADAGNAGLLSIMQGDEYIGICQKDGRYYQLKASFTGEAVEAWNNLDYDADDYDDQLKAVYDLMKVEECWDFTQTLPKQEEMDVYVGKTVGELFAEGFEGSGWVVDEDAFLYLAKDGFVYKMQVTLPDGFDTEDDIEYEDFSDAVIQSVEFSEVELYLFPIP